MLLRIFYFILLGWWLGALWALVAYLLSLTVIGLPIAVMMWNVLPKVLTLKPTRQETVRVKTNGQTVSLQVTPKEVPFLLRVIYFFAIGWWLGGLMLGVGFLLCLTIVLLPVGLFLLNRLPAILTLKRAY